MAHRCESATERVALECPRLGRPASPRTSWSVRQKTGVQIRLTKPVLDLPLLGLLSILPLLIVSGLMLGGLGMLLSSWIRQLENFAGIMNFVIFPMFFLSSALYPLWRMRESSELLYWICALNPFTHAVETLRHDLYGQMNWPMAGFTLLALVAFVGGAIWAYDPTRGMLSRRAGPPGG